MTITRRLFAGSLAAIGTTPFVPAASAAPKGAGLSAELAPMVARLDAAVEGYRTSVAAARAAYREWMPKLPLAPDCCTYGRNSRFHLPGEDMERDIFGTAFTREGEEEPRYVRSAESMRETAAHFRAALAKDAKRKRSHGKPTRDKWAAKVDSAELGLELLPAYLAERDAILKASRGRDLAAARNAAGEALVALVADILAAPTRSPEDVKAKAKAAKVLGGMSRGDALFAVGTKAPEMVAGLAEALAFSTA